MASAARGRQHLGHGDPGDRPLDVRAELDRALVARRRVLGQRLEHQSVQGRRHRGFHGAGRRRVLIDVREGHRDRRIAPERGPPGEQLEEHHAGGVQVAARVHGPALGLLRGQVGRRPQDRRRAGAGVARVGGGPRDPEVHDLDRAGRGEHDVARLDVAVDDPVPVAVVQCRQDPGSDLQRALGHEGVARVQQLLEGDSLDELHHDERHDRGTRAIAQGILAGVVHGNDVRVVQRGRALRLTAEPGQEGRVAGQLGLEDLDGHPAAEPQVPALVHLSHAPTAEQLAHLVPVAEPSHVAHRRPLLLRHPARP